MEFVNGKDDIPYMKWKMKNVWNHQPDINWTCKIWINIRPLCRLQVLTQVSAKWGPTNSDVSWLPNPIRILVIFVSFNHSDIGNVLTKKPSTSVPLCAIVSLCIVSYYLCIILCHLCINSQAIDEFWDPVTPCEADQQHHQPFGGQGMPHHLLYGDRVFPPGFSGTKKVKHQGRVFLCKKNGPV